MALANLRSLREALHSALPEEIFSGPDAAVDILLFVVNILDTSPSEILSHLTKQEGVLVRILHEWWYSGEAPSEAQLRGRYSHGTLPPMSTTAFKSLEDLINSPSTDDFELRELLLSMSGHDKFLEMTGLSDYGQVVYDMWERELGDDKTWTYNYGNEDRFKSSDSETHRRFGRDGLRSERQLCVRKCAAHRVARCAVAHLCSKVDPEASEAAISGSTDVLGLLRDKIPASIEVCHWLPVTRQWPFYLWDSHVDATIECPPHGLEYLVISHTWGRWLTPGDASVLGTPWKVPRNSIFDVEQLPAILRKASSAFGIRYIWMDLVSIPQGNHNVERQQIEIGKQADIFFHAAVATVWFNQVVGDWNPIASGIQHAASIFFRLEPMVTGDSSSTTVYGEKRTGLVRYAESGGGQSEGIGQSASKVDDEASSSHNSSTSMEFDGWFTSLWTLQETCMRPDMVLTNQTWDILSINGPFIITLDHLILFLAMVAQASHVNLNEFPLAIRECLKILVETDLINLPNLSKSSIIHLGTKRYCSDQNRALAIMSPLGITDWHAEYRHLVAMGGADRNPSNHGTFVFEQYPLEFLREAHEKIGALFFSSTSRFSGTLSQFQRYIVDVGLPGTMLPFRSQASKSASNSSGGDAGVEDHPTVAQWLINGDGSVRMSRASILAAWPPRPGQRPVIDSIVMATQPDGEDVDYTGDLVEWLGSFRPHAEKFAIRLYKYYVDKFYGLILERVYNGREVTNLVKIGTFTINGDDENLRDEGTHFRYSEDVDWAVL